MIDKSQLSNIQLSRLTHDPILAEIFRRSEGDGLAAAEIERPDPPRRDGAATRMRHLEFV